MAPERDSPPWTQVRRELHDWFTEQVPSLSEGYVAAVELVHRIHFPARVTLVCHLVRDVYVRVPKALGSKEKKIRPMEVYPQLVTNLRDAWDDESTLAAQVRPDGNRLIGPRAYAAAEKLVQRSRELKKQPSYGTRLARSLVKAMDRPEGMSPPGWTFAAFDEEYDFFIERAHLNLKGAPSDEGLLEHFEAFERAFHSMVGSYFSGKEELDAILGATNRAND